MVDFKCTLSRFQNSLIIPSAYSFVLSLRSRSPMVGRLHPLSFILYPFKPHRVRDACPDKTCLSPFLPELPRFENSRNIEMTWCVKAEGTSAIPTICP